MATIAAGRRSTPRSDSAPAGSALSAHWTWSYGLFHASTRSVDSLLLVYCTVLGMSPSMVAAVDAMGSVGSVMGDLTLGNLVDRLGPRLLLVVSLFLAPALIMVGFGATKDLPILLGLSLVWGVVFVGPLPAASVFITRVFRRDAWASQQVRLSTASTLGTAVGMALATGWLAVSTHLWGEAWSIRVFFVIGAAVAAAGALAAALWTRGPGKASGTVEGASEHHVGAPMSSRQRVRAATVEGSPDAPYSDPLRSLFLGNLVMFMGLGMFAALFPVYMKRELHAEGYKIIAGSLALGLTGTLGLTVIGRAMAKPLSLRFHAMAIAVRGLVVLAIGSVGFFLRPLPAQIVVIGLMGVIGLCSAATGAFSSTRVVALAPFSKKGAATGQLGALTFFALAAGALLGGFTAQHFGFFPAFALAALWLFISSAMAWRL